MDGTGGDAVVAGEPGQRQLQDQLAGALRPAAFPFGLGKAPQVATDIDEDAGEFWPDAGERPVDTLAGGDDVVAQVGR